MRARNKNALIGGLLAIVFVMAIGYASFAQLLTINGQAGTNSHWEVKITNIVEKSHTGNASSTQPAAGSVNPSYTDTTATFSSDLVAPGDSITYTVTISNNGNIPAKVDEVKWLKADSSDDTTNVYSASPIIYSYSFPSQNVTLAAGTSTTLDVTVTYDEDVTTQPASADLAKTAILSINYVQATS